MAHRDPVLKKVGAELVILDDQEIIAEGYSEVNDPYFWNGLKFHVTNIAVDQNGFLYAGLQIVRDPGVRFVSSLVLLSYALGACCICRRVSGERLSASLLIKILLYFYPQPFHFFPQTDTAHAEKIGSLGAVEIMETQGL